MLPLTLRRTLKPMTPLALLLAMGCGHGSSPSLPSHPGAQLGVEILGVELLADGDIARLNYRVIDYDAARKAFDQPVRLQTADGNRGMDVMQAGRLGPLRQRPSKTGKRQFILFPNNGRPLARGGKATLRVGEVLIHDIPVT